MQRPTCGQVCCIFWWLQGPEKEYLDQIEQQSKDGQNKQSAEQCKC